MNFNRDFIRKTRDQLDELGIRVRWVGRMPKLWKSVAKELQIAQEQTKDNDRLTLYFCMNYGGRAEIADAAQALAEDVKAGRLDPSKVNEKTFAKYLYYPDMPDVDLFLRPSGEQRTSNYLLWQSAYAEMVFQDVLWPDFDRRDLWRACVEFASRDRRFGGADPERGAAGHGGPDGGLTLGRGRWGERGAGVPGDGRGLPRGGPRVHACLGRRPVGAGAAAVSGRGGCARHVLALAARRGAAIPSRSS